MRDSSRFLLLVPSAKLIWAYDNESKMSFVDAFQQDDYIASHVVLVPGDFRSSDKSRLMGTFNSRQIILNKNFIQTHQGFKNAFHSQIVAEYIIRPSAPFLPDDAQFLCCEISYPLTGTPVYHDLIERPGIEIRKSLFQGKILDVPESIGLDLEKIKADVHRLRDFKLLPVIYGQELSRLDMEFAVLVNTFYCDDITTKEDLTKRHNDTIDVAISKFQALGSATINKIATETGLSGTDLANMIGLHIENQLHSTLWEKTLELCLESDTKTQDNCWKVKDISIEQVGIPVKNTETLFDLDELVSEAVKLFSSISTVSGVQSKTKVLLMVMQILSGGTPKPDPLENEALQRVSKCSVHYNSELRKDPHYVGLQSNISADVLISLMLLVVIRSNIICVSSTLYYIQAFSFEDVNLGQLGYALSTLEAVLYHLDENATKMIVLSQANSRLWSTLKLRNDFEVVIKELLTDNPDGVSVLRNRTPSGLTLLMHSVQEQDLGMFRHLLALEAFDDKFILADRDSFGSTLFINALDGEQKEILEILLEKLRSLDSETQRKYFSRLNNWKRSVGHYIFHAHWLLPSLGRYINWEQRDHAGQTPLFSVCRCYDHPNYSILLRDSFASWEENFKARHSNTKRQSLAYHIDPKDNSLLHVLKDTDAIKQLLKHDLDVNWPNEHGYTPLMFYSKFSRVESIKILLNDERLDSHLQGENGVNAIEVARDLDTIIYLESECCFFFLVLFVANCLGVYLSDEKTQKADRTTGIVRTSLSQGSLLFVICTGDPRNPGTITSVRRSIEDFRFLEKWLFYENPHSWVPSLYRLFNPKFLRGKIIYQLFHEIQIKLNTFLKVLTLHPTFANHELLWEFLLVQDITRDNIIDRCRRKLESQRESQLESAILYNPGDLDLIEVFFNHARQEIGSLSKASHMLHQGMMRMASKVEDYNTAYRILSELFAKMDLVRGDMKYERLEQKVFVLASLLPEYIYSEFSVSLQSVSGTIDTVLGTIQRPLALIKLLRERDRDLVTAKETLEKLSNKNAWPMGMFEEKRAKDMQFLHDRIYICQNEITRLNSDVKCHHITLASEIGSVYATHENVMMQMIKSFSSKLIMSQKVSLERLERIRSNLKNNSLNTTENEKPAF